jgi:hypothetical protein
MDVFLMVLENQRSFNGRGGGLKCDHQDFGLTFGAVHYAASSTLPPNFAILMNNKFIFV